MCLPHYLSFSNDIDKSSICLFKDLVKEIIFCLIQTVNALTIWNLNSSKIWWFTLKLFLDHDDLYGSSSYLVSLERATKLSFWRKNSFLTKWYCGFCLNFALIFRLKAGKEMNFCTNMCCTLNREDFQFAFLCYIFMYISAQTIETICIDITL